MTPYLGDRPALYAQIHTRIREMLDAGWIAETRSLIEQGYTLEDPGLGSIGYREIYQYIQGEITETEMYDRIAQFTRNYAKRQITWGKRYSTIL